MALQGLDRAVPPPAATAKKMLDSIDGQWWNVYIGGPEATNAWKPDELRQYVQAGIRRFMLTYVGRQHRGPLTKAQGHADGREALAIAKAFGYSGKVPLCLDVELPTWEGAKQPTVEYTKAWCATVREGGARPGVYANPAPLKDMAAGKIGADFVWVASWVSQTAAKHDPHHVPQLPDELWAKPGMRAWQYAGAFNGKPCEVMGFNVDINVSDPGCLAGPPGRASGKLPAQSSSGVLRRGNRGKRVQLLTRRLAYLRSRRSGEPYLDEPRARFDAKTEDGARGLPARAPARGRRRLREPDRAGAAARDPAPAQRGQARAEAEQGDAAHADRRRAPPRRGHRPRLGAAGRLRRRAPAPARPGRRRRRAQR